MKMFKKCGKKARSLVVRILGNGGRISVARGFTEPHMEKKSHSMDGRWITLILMAETAYQIYVLCNGRTTLTRVTRNG